MPVEPSRRSLIGPLLAPERVVARYAAAVALVLAIGAIRLSLSPLLGREAPLLPFLLAVWAAAVIGGRGPAWVATFLTPVIVVPLFTAWPDGTHLLAFSIHVAFFVLVGICVTLIMDQLQGTVRAQQEEWLAARRAERHATETASQLRLIADAMPVLIAYVDTEHRYRFNNQRYEEWFGQSPEAVQGRHAREVLGDDAYAAVLPKMEEALAGRPVHFQAQLPYFEAGPRHVEAHYIPDVGPDGRVRGYCALVEDVTELRRHEQQLKEAQQRLTLALRAGRAGSFDWDITANASIWSEELLALHGFSPGEFGGSYDAWLDCLVPADRKRLRVAFERALKDGETAVEFRIRRRDTGEVRWMHGRGQVLYDGSRSPVRMIGITADITERKRAEQALREREQMLKLIYDNTSDGLYLVEVGPDEQCRVVSVNETFLKVTGYTRREVDGQLLEAVFPADGALMRAKFIVAIASRRPLIYEETAELPAGRRCAEFTLIPISTADGPVTHVLGAMKDVTEKKQAEEALREADRRKDEFLAMLAHELRNPWLRFAMSAIFSPAASAQPIPCIT